jgi:hypothetical protein
LAILIKACKGDIRQWLFVQYEIYFSFEDGNLMFFISFKEKSSKQSAIADILYKGLFFIYFLPFGLFQPP